MVRRDGDAQPAHPDAPADTQPLTGAQQYWQEVRQQQVLRHLADGNTTYLLQVGMHRDYLPLAVHEDDWEQQK